MTEDETRKMSKWTSYPQRVTRFGADRKLYITLGERGEGRRAQDLMDLNGKTLRLNDDGSVPSDNPFVGRKDVRPEIFSFGHRNSQGMAIHPQTGLIFQTEHGPSWDDAPGGGDEVNLVAAGANYGWPIVHHRDTLEGTAPPLVEYTPVRDAFLKERRLVCFFGYYLRRRCIRARPLRRCPSAKDCAYKEVFEAIGNISQRVGNCCLADRFMRGNLEFHLNSFADRGAFGNCSSKDFLYLMQPCRN